MFNTTLRNTNEEEDGFFGGEYILINVDSNAIANEADMVSFLEYDHKHRKSTLLLPPQQVGEER